MQFEILRLYDIMEMYCWATKKPSPVGEGRPRSGGWGVNMIPYNKKLVSTAKTLRKSMTPEEKHLWYDFLKRLPLNVRRQHNIENYIVDFYIAEKKIVIEVDGGQHLLPEHKEADKKRDACLASWGISVLRYSNDSIRNQFNAVTENILKSLGLDFSDLKPLWWHLIRQASPATFSRWRRLSVNSFFCWNRRELQNTEGNREIKSDNREVSIAKATLQRVAFVFC